VAAFLSAREAFLLLFGQGLDEIDTRNLISRAGPLFSEAAYAAVQIGDSELAISLLSQGRARLMAIALRERGLVLSEQKRLRHDAVKTEIRQLSRVADTTSGSERFAALTRLTTLRTELSELVKTGLANESPGKTMALLRSLLSAGDALAAPIVTSSGGKLLIVTRAADAPVLSVIELPQPTNKRVAALMRGPVAGNLGGWLGALAIQYISDPEEAGRRYGEWLNATETIGPELWQLVGGPLRKGLAARGVKPGARLLWMPPGALGLLPIGLAQEGLAGRPLGDIYEMVNVPSLEALADAARQAGTPSRRSLAAIINPTGDLPFTETEGALIAGHFPLSAQLRLVNASATPEAGLQALRGRSYWHFSSHGTFCWKDARQSGLILANAEAIEHCGLSIHGAPLTVGRLLDSEGALGRPRLVVLSACETGIYDIDRNPDEFVGLPATFMQLGATGVVGTLWQVDDMATALLIAKFYDLHIGQGERPSAALGRAQAWLSRATRFELIAFAKTAGARAKLDPRGSQRWRAV
jgi:CHAT domain-containing protein